MGVTLYEIDFVLWTEDQAGKLRQARDTGSNLDLDWQHLIDEVEWLGITDRRSLLTDVMCVLEHLTKLEWSPAFDPRRSWVDRVDQHRDRIATLLREPLPARRAPRRAQRRLGADQAAGGARPRAEPGQARVAPRLPLHGGAGARRGVVPAQPLRFRLGSAPGHRRARSGRLTAGETSPAQRRYFLRRSWRWAGRRHTRGAGPQRERGPRAQNS